LDDRKSGRRQKCLPIDLDRRLNGNWAAVKPSDSREESATKKEESGKWDLDPSDIDDDLVL